MLPHQTVIASEKSDTRAGVALTSEVVPAREVQGTKKRWQLMGFFAATLGCVVGYFGYVLAFGVNAVFWDSFAWGPFLDPGQPTFTSLWAQHNEDRFLFPNMIAAGVLRLSHWNDILMMLIGAGFLVGCLAIAVKVFYREITYAPLLGILMAPIALSLGQFQNTLWSYQFAWPMALVCTFACFAILSRARISKAGVVLAVATGIVGSYSLFQGLFIWPIGVVLLLARGKGWRWPALWGAMGVLVSLVYFAGGFDFSSAGSAPLSYLDGHIWYELKGVLISAGSVLPNIALGMPHLASQHITEAVGIVIIAAGAFVIISWLRAGRPAGPHAFCVGLILLSLLFDVSLVPGRTAYNELAGSTSRYNTYEWPLLLGLYGYALIVPRRIGLQTLRFAGRAAVSALVVAVVGVSTVVGDQQGPVTRDVHLTSADVLANISTASTAVEAPYLMPPCADDAALCRLVTDAVNGFARNQLNVFDDSRHVASLRALGIVPGGAAVSLLPVPAYLSGEVEASLESRRAWNVLSAVYRTDPSVQARYPHPALQMRGLLQWAADAGGGVTPQAIKEAEWSAPVSSGFFLQPYVDTYRRWLSKVSWSESS